MGDKFSKKNAHNFKNTFIPFTNHKLKYSNELTKDSYSFGFGVNSFCIFNSIDNILNLVYTDDEKSIISFNLIDNKKINEIKHSYKDEDFISQFIHYFDEKNKRDLILVVYSCDNYIRLWNANIWECVLELKDINRSGNLNSACFLNYNNQIYFLTSNNNIMDKPSPIKVYDLNGIKINEIKESKDSTYFIDIYYDIKSSKTYIITGNNQYNKSYDYKNNKVYHKYLDNTFDEEVGSPSDIEIRDTHCLVIIDFEKIIKMLEASSDGYIRVWNFHSGLLLNKIEVCDRDVYDICLWNKEYLFVGCNDKKIRLLNIKEGTIIEELTGHKKYVVTIKKFLHPKYGECLISQGHDEDQIKLWINRD